MEQIPDELRKTARSLVYERERLGLSQKCCQSVAEVYGTDFLPFGGADLRLVPLAVVPHTAPHG